MGPFMSSFAITKILVRPSLSFRAEFGLLRPNRLGYCRASKLTRPFVAVARQSFPIFYFFLSPTRRLARLKIALQSGSRASVWRTDAR